MSDKIKKIKFLSLINLLNFIILFSQDIKFKHIAHEFGSAQRGISSIIQDKYGFMWFGTFDGLNRYNGFEFEIFNPIIGDTNSLSNKTINTLFEDHLGQIWIGTYDGLNIYHQLTKTFTVYKHNPNDEFSLSDNYVNTIYEDKFGIIWIGTNNGLNLFDPITKKFSILKKNPNDSQSLLKEKINKIYDTQENKILIGSETNGVYSFDQSNKVLTNLKEIIGPNNNLSNNKILSFYSDNKFIWIGTTFGLNRFDKTSKKLKFFFNKESDPFSLTGNRINSLFHDSQGRLWIGTLGGLSYFNPSNDSFISLRNDPKDLSTIADNTVYEIYEDNSGGLWVGTYIVDGLNYFNVKSKKFDPFYILKSDKYLLSNNAIYSFLNDKDKNFWVGTLDGLFFLNTSTNKLNIYKENFLPNKTVNALVQDKIGQIWIGTRNGLTVYNTKNQKKIHFNHIEGDVNSLVNDQIYSLVEDHLNKIWIGTNGGLSTVDIESKKISNLNILLNDSLELSSKRINSISRGPTNDLWFGTWRGFYKYQVSTDQFKYFKHDSNNKLSISSDNVLSIHQDQLTNVWIGLFDGGLVKFNPTTEVFKTYLVSNGLPDNTIYGILESKDNKLWLSSNRGISEFDPVLETFTNYDISDGLQDNEYNSGAYYKASDGKMYFGGINGITSFYPDSIKNSKIVPTVVITDLKIFNKLIEVGKNYDGFVLDRSITFLDEIILPYKKYIFTLEFSALNYSESKRNKYAYQLIGFDDNWTVTDSRRRYATFTNLDPGSYVFNVKISNDDGTWIKEGKKINIVIKPPWWKTWWVYVLYIFAFIGSIFWIVRYQVNKNRIKNEIENSKNLALINKDLEKAIIELKDTQGQLLQSEKMASIGILVAGLAHEINNPAAILSANTELVEMSVSNLKDQLNNMIDKQGNLELIKPLTPIVNNIHNFLQPINLSLNRIQAIIKNLKSFSSLDKENFNSVDLNLGIQNTLYIYKNQIKEHITLETNYGKLPFVKCYLNQIMQVVANLLSNSLDALEKIENPIIKISTTLEDSHSDLKVPHIKFEIVDNGIGIKKENINKIFDPFYSSKEFGTGKGLGLSIAYGIIKHHKGHLSISSEENVSTSAIFRIPINL